MPTSGTFLRQLSTKKTWKPHSKRWVGDKNRESEMGQRNWNQMEVLKGENGGFGAEGLTRMLREPHKARTEKKLGSHTDSLSKPESLPNHATILGF
ncbi:hypothetical protein Droror1_Dr00007218 [Drosera rotundifolia]